MNADQEERDEGLGGKLVRALKNSQGSGKRDIDVEHGGASARARVHGSGPYGSSIDELTVVGPEHERSEEQAGRTVERQVERLESDVTYLPERIKSYEVAPGLGKGILRSQPGEMRDREYHEFELRGGVEVEVSRYRYAEHGGGRERIPQTYSHELLERLTDDLADALDPAEEDDDR
jgi:hypothetical protein